MKTHVLGALTGFLLFLMPALSGPWHSSAQEAKDVPDVTNLKLEDYHIPLVKPTKDPKTGFIVGGKNPTELIRRLTEINGRTIADLEKEMRPGESSTAGFLGKDEKLLDVLAEDNKYVVEKLGLTHQELARHLHVLGAAWNSVQPKLKADNNGPRQFLYHGRKYLVTGRVTRGFQHSPFKDETKSGTDVTVENAHTGKKLTYGLLVPFMIERYGFYEGKSTNYRVEPKDVVEVFDFLKKK